MTEKKTGTGNQQLFDRIIDITIFDGVEGLDSFIFIQSRFKNVQIWSTLFILQKGDVQHLQIKLEKTSYIIFERIAAANPQAPLSRGLRMVYIRPSFYVYSPHLTLLPLHRLHAV